MSTGKLYGLNYVHFSGFATDKRAHSISVLFHIIGCLLGSHSCVDSDIYFIISFMARFSCAQTPFQRPIAKSMRCISGNILRAKRSTISYRNWNCRLIAALRAKTLAPEVDNKFVNVKFGCNPASSTDSLSVWKNVVDYTGQNWIWGSSCILSLRLDDVFVLAWPYSISCVIDDVEGWSEMAFPLTFLMGTWQRDIHSNIPILSSLRQS